MQRGCFRLGYRLSVVLLIVSIGAIFESLDIAYMTFGSAVPPNAVSHVAIAGIVSIFAFVAIGFLVRFTYRPPRAYEPLSLGFVAFLALLIATACCACFFQARSVYASDPSCRSMVPAPGSAAAPCSVQPITIARARISPTLLRSLLLDVRTADGSTEVLDLGWSDSLLWREAVARPGLAVYARSFHGTVVRVASAGYADDTTASPCARLKTAVAFAAIVGACGIVACGAALRKSLRPI